MKHSTNFKQLFCYWYNYKLVTNVGQVCTILETVEEFVTEQTLDTDSELVSSDQTNQSRLTESSQLETSSLTPNSNWPHR